MAAVLHGRDHQMFNVSDQFQGNLFNGTVSALLLCVLIKIHHYFSRTDNMLIVYQDTYHFPSFIIYLKVKSSGITAIIV